MGKGPSSATGESLLALKEKGEGGQKKKKRM
jgi:hypothetical protein